MQQPTHHTDAFAGPRVMPIMDKNVERLFLGSISQARPASANLGLLVPSVTRLAATTALFSISGFPSSFPNSRSPAVTAAMLASCAVSPASSSSSSTIGASNRSTPAPVVTSTRSSRNVMGAARPFSPARSRSTNGTPSLVTRRLHDASSFERVVRRTCVLNSTICVFERLICQGIPLVIWWPDNRPF